MALKEVPGILPGTGLAKNPPPPDLPTDPARAAYKRKQATIVQALTTRTSLISKGKLRIRYISVRNNYIHNRIIKNQLINTLSRSSRVQLRLHWAL